MPTTASTDATRHFGGVRYGLAFEYPSAWHEAPYKDTPSSLGTPIVFLSNGTIHAPCTHTFSDHRQSEEIRCGSPIKNLRPGEFLVTWGEYSNFGNKTVHPNTTIDGKPAEINMRPGSCNQIGGQVLVSAVIPRGRFNILDMTACLRGPDLDRTKALVRGMLRSVHIYN